VITCTYISVIFSVKMKFILITVTILLSLGSLTYGDDQQCGCGEEDYRSHGWKFLHAIAEKNENTHECGMHLAMIIESLSNVFPCDTCKEHLTEFIKESIEKVPPDLPQCSGLWMCRFHNDVNRRLGKEEFDCSQYPDDLIDLENPPPEEEPPVNS